jgi:hypothetical protein
MLVRELYTHPCCNLKCHSIMIMVHPHLSWHCRTLFLEPHDMRIGLLHAGNIGIFCKRRRLTNHISAFSDASLLSTRSSQHIYQALIRRPRLAFYHTACLIRNDCVVSNTLGSLSGLPHAGHVCTTCVYFAPRQSSSTVSDHDIRALSAI